MRDRVYRTDAIMLRHSDWAEADRMLTILTPRGKRRVIAKGARKTNSRLAGHIELFTHATLLLATGRTYDIVTQSTILDGFDTLRRDLHTISAAFYACELVDRLTEQDGEETAVFTLLLEALRVLDQHNDRELVLRAFELQLLDALGYQPQLRACARCSARLTEETAHFSPAAGGALCATCARLHVDAATMSLAAFKLLRYLQINSIATTAHMTISPETRAEAEHLLRGYLKQILERDLRSTALLDELRNPLSAPEAAVPRSTRS